MVNNNKSTAMMFTDIVGYSSMVSKDQEYALKLLDMHDRIVDPIINNHKGNIIKRIGNSNDIPDANNRNIVNFIYSEYLDSSCIGNDPSTKLSQDIKKDHIIGIKKKYANNIPRKKNIIDIIDTNTKTFFSFLYNAGEVKRIV